VNKEALRIRQMTVNDIPAGMRLREAAGWNQTERDWRRFLDLVPDGCFVATLGGEICGTATALRYGTRVGWLGMVLVDPAVRRQGIGSRLFQHAMEYLRRYGVETQKLDATPQGYPIYKSLGFLDEYVLERWERSSGKASGSAASRMTVDDLDQVCAWDREVFGADRGDLLRCLWREGSQYCFVVRAGLEVRGYSLGRAGSRAHYAGPWVAEPGSGAAAELLRSFLLQTQGEPVYVDIRRDCSEARQVLTDSGFHMQRTLTRMYLGPDPCGGCPEFVYGIAGPELG
jgi:GNAT superfamily N-acetyltransferase